MNYLDILTPAEADAESRASEFGLEEQGLTHFRKAYWNLPVAALYEEAIFRREGAIAAGGPFLTCTKPHTARAASDKFVVEEDETKDKVWWGSHNRPLSEEKFQSLFHRMRAFLQRRDLFVQDCFAGADPEHRLPVRIVTEKSWHSFFARNMFLTTESEDLLRRHRPAFTVLDLPSFKADPEIEGTRSETAIIINFKERLALICNSLYGGEIKKSIFTVLNYLLPLKDVLSMHCSANVGKEKDPALFFGLSGTGKTTLSADPRRELIGDDEHGWSENGVFNFEGGCYAKVIRLSAENEPEIYACTSRYGTILENVVYDPATRQIDLDDDSITENTRASYPLEFIPNSLAEKRVESHPRNIILLTCDAYGVLPPIARLSPEQTMYHFISGYTSKIAGTEIGLGKEPKPTFSACFGAPFMVHHPSTYAQLLSRKMKEHDVATWLVNTGWTGGAYGAGERISIKHTRAILNSALDGKLDAIDFRKDKLFGFQVPLTCPDVPEEILDPAQSWDDQDAYWKTYRELASQYIENFKKFEADSPEEVAQAGPDLDAV